MSPVSGSEPKLNMNIWNTKKPLKESHNCYSYAMNAVDPKKVQICNDTPDCNTGTHQPGYASGFTKFADQTLKGCGDMVSRVWGDNPDVKATTFSEQCNPGTSKIALIVDPKRDYHFLRQDPDGYWSHKPGGMNVTRLDATGREIIRPDRASFIYKNHKEPLMYTKFCGYFCVPRDKSMHLTSEARRGGASLISQKPRRYRQTRRKSRGVRFA
jgi:hypothetical protein